MKRLAIICALALTGCAHGLGAAPKEVRVPIAVKCAADPGQDPAFADTPEAIRQAADIFERVKLLLAGREQREARIAELEAANAGCRK